MADGIHLIKIFLAIQKDEQLRRFKDRLRDPYKHWKISKEDVEARAKWNLYVAAADEMLKRSTYSWNLIPANDKNFARIEVLKAVISPLNSYGEWIQKEAKRFKGKDLNDHFDSACSETNLSRR